MAIFRAITDGNNNDLAIWEIYDGVNWNPADRLPSANDDDDVYLNDKKIELVADMSARLITNMQDDNINVEGGSQLGGYLNLTGSYNINLVGDLVDYGRGNVNYGLLQILSTYTGNLYQFGKLDKVNVVLGNVVINESSTGLKIFEGEKLGSPAGGLYAFGNLGDNVILRGDLVGRYTGSNPGAVYNQNSNVQSFIIENGVLSAISSAFINYQSNCKFVFKNCVVRQNTDSGSTIWNDQTTTELHFENCEFQLYPMTATPQKALLNKGVTTYKNCSWRIGASELDSQLFYTNDFLDTNTPQESDVRSNIIYGVGGDKIGTLAVPPPESVVKNVPTDDTVGTLPISQTISTDDITEIKQTLEVIDLNVQNINVDFTPVNNKLDIIENKIDNIEINVGDVDVDLAPINEKLDLIKIQTDKIKDVGSFEFNNFASDFEYLSNYILFYPLPSQVTDSSQTASVLDKILENEAKKYIEILNIDDFEERFNVLNESKKTTILMYFAKFQQFEVNIYLSKIETSAGSELQAYNFSTHQNSIDYNKAIMEGVNTIRGIFGEENFGGSYLDQFKIRVW